ncbi:MAG: hypothetical protein OXC92_00665 [Flavobacteriaceae bacterium]|nr:hypothetical protein [Flavobacteriaceae bacterium]
MASHQFKYLPCNKDLVSNHPSFYFNSYDWIIKNFDSSIQSLHSIANQCKEDLSAYTQYLSLEGASTNDILPSLLLPSETQPKEAHEVVHSFKSWVISNYQSKGPFLVELDFLWNFAGLKPEGRLLQREKSIWIF